MRNKLYILISILLMSALLTACAGAAFAQSSSPTAQATAKSSQASAEEEKDSQPATRTISVNGTGLAYLTPDMAYVNIGVHTEGKSAAAVVDDNNTQTQKVIAALKAFKIDDKDFKTINFSIYPQQVYDSQGKPTGEITYTVDNTVYVTVRDLKTLGDLLDAVVKAGANSINGIQFDVADKSKAYSDARKAAVANAQATAQELAAAAGVTLGAVQTISTYSNAPTPVYDGGVIMKAVEAAAVPVSPGQMTITVDVSVVYEIQ
jgi:uncharacterized protein YggE